MSNIWLKEENGSRWFQSNEVRWFDVVRGDAADKWCVIARFRGDDTLIIVHTVSSRDRGMLWLDQYIKNMTALSAGDDE